MNSFAQILMNKIHSRWSLEVLPKKTLHLTILTTQFQFTVGNKKARLSAETDHDTGSESSPSSPRVKSKSYSIPLSPSRHQASPSSPESDLDVDDSAPEEATPENLSLKKKERSKSPAGNNNFNTSLGFLPYQQPYHQPNVSTSPTQRSPVDVLLRFVTASFQRFEEFTSLHNSQGFPEPEAK